VECSVVSYPERGPYGSNKFRGNTSGLLIKDILLWLKPKKVLDPMAGSYTTRDVCEELGIENVCLDLKQGFNALEMDFLNEFDLVFLHPPYWNIIRYSQDPRDLSNAPTYKDFLNKLQTILSLSVRALKKNGYLVLLIGDFRKKGVYTCIARDIRDPENTRLIQEIIKIQHNVRSNLKNTGQT
jgi:DNA modification methylase